MVTALLLIAFILATIGAGFVTYGADQHRTKRASVILGTVYLWTSAYIAGWLSGDGLVQIVMYWLIEEGPDVGY
jgi:hypothetical protein